LLENNFSDTEYTQATTYDEIIAYCSSSSPPNLILIDLQIPGWPGFEGIRNIRALLPKTPLVVFSLFENGADARLALNHGADGFIPKSSSVQIIVSALRLILAGGVYVPHALLQSDVSDQTSASGDHAAPFSSSDVGHNVSLTQRQLDVLNCLRQGKSNKQIA